jgi:hypothetical protein
MRCGMGLLFLFLPSTRLAFEASASCASVRGTNGQAYCGFTPVSCGFPQQRAATLPFPRACPRLAPQFQF